MREWTPRWGAGHSTLRGTNAGAALRNTDALSINPADALSASRAKGPGGCAFLRLRSPSWTSFSTVSWPRLQVLGAGLNDTWERLRDGADELIDTDSEVGFLRAGHVVAICQEDSAEPLQF